MARLDPAQLYTPCDFGPASFDSSTELADLDEFIGQRRAVDAVAFATGMTQPGYNLFVVGPEGVGKHSLVERVLRARAAEQETPCDWCYVNNFTEPTRPNALRLPPGRGADLRGRMARFVDELRTVLPAAFDSEQYRAKVESLHEAFSRRQEQALEALGSEAAQQGIALLRTPEGFAFAPARAGEVLPPEEYEKLPDVEKERIEARVRQFQERLQSLLRQFPSWRRESREQLRALNHDTALAAVQHLMDELREAFSDLPLVLEYFDAVERDIVEHAELFLKREEAGADGAELPVLHRYQVNLMVDHAQTRGAPIVAEDHPMYNTLLGRVEHVAQMGALVTDFTLIKPGALHRANGGYLLLDAHKVLSQPFAWEALKRALYAREIRIESLGQILSLVSTVSLEPEPIPLRVKVVLFGERLLYYLLREFDPEFAELFKVSAEFEEDMPRSSETTLLYARLIATLARREGLLELGRAAIARVIEHAARMVGDAEKLSTHMERVVDLLRQADYWARQAGARRMEAEHVQRAIDAIEERASRVKARIQEEILRGTLMIDTVGAMAGQVNGLSVIELGGHAFAHPVRITATTRIGEGDVINIEREVELSGAIHSKGVLTLAAFLAARFARTRPLSLNASLAFEQSYGYVEGDSASLAELCALLSDLAQVPIKQSWAVTGSVNQFGQVQAIGAVNEKIEGFFDICQARGLTGEQGVLIPAANVKHLMLKQSVRDAVAAGRFHIHAVSDVDEAMEQLTGVAAGVPDASGALPEGTINYRVALQLMELSLIRQSFAANGKSTAPRRRKKKG